MKNKKKHINIPVFIPHLGCPNMCVFCNQRTISGVSDFKAESVIDGIEAVLSSVQRDETEIELAFFGGSFTGIDRELMISLLMIGKSYLDRGLIDSMRCSTRPDYINEEILGILKKYGMKTIELGIQSMSDKVLSKCKRGHVSEDTRRACTAVLEAGFELVGQMMIGLPGADEKSECECARFICESGCVGARVYPTVVFFGTELVCMCKSGEYTPLDTESAVERTKRVLDVFDKAAVPVIRVGLCASENLTDGSRVFAGANDAAIGERAMSALYFDRICALIDSYKQPYEDRACVIYAAIGSVSKIVGQRKCNKLALIKKYGFKSVKIVEKTELIGYNIRIDIL